MRRATIPLLAGALLIAAAPDPFSRVVDALDTAAHSGSLRARTRAAEVLASNDARPLDGTRDLALAWKSRSAPARAAYRNRALGPAYRVVAVRPGGSVTFEQVFLAGQRARVAVIAKAPASVRLAVTDDDGKPQCDGGAGRCDWVPLWTTRYSIELNNRGAAPASYYVVMQ